MNQQHTIFGRIGHWFKRGNGDSSSDLPLLQEGNPIVTQEPKTTLFRPWARRDAAITNLQEGFRTLTELMAAVRDNLERQGHRQDELLQYLSHLPQALDSLPESSRMQGETLKAIHQQLEQQNTQQGQLAEILETISETSTSQKQTLNALHERVETLHQHDQSIADHLSGVGSAMQTVSRNSQTSAQVLENMRDNINSRDGELERILHRQNTRFTTMLAIAIFLSIAALAAVAVVGYLGYEAMNKGH